MSLNLSATAELLIERRNVTPNLIIEIDGVDTLYSSVTTYKLSRFGEDDLLFGDPGLVFGGSIIDPNTETLISLGDTGTTISQQLLQDKGAVSSVSSFAVELIDKNQKITRLITPGEVVEELLDRRAKVWINFAGGVHPEDSVLIHSGIIDEISCGPASAKLNIASPENQKRQDLFIPFNTSLNGSINNSVTTITVDSTANFLTQYGSEFETFIKIDDEIIQYTGKTSTTFTGCSRGQLGSVADSHDDNTSVDSFYRVRENGINFALKLMMSMGDEYFAEQSIFNIGAFSSTSFDEHILYFYAINVKEKYGLTEGDFVTIDGSSFNDAIDLQITGFGTDDTGSWIEFAESFTVELSTPAIASFKSQFNVWPEGMGMTPYDVDVQGHLDIKNQYFSSIPEYDFYFKPEDNAVKGKDFLSKEIYFPAALYSLPRKTKAGVGITLPPVSSASLKELNQSNVANASQIKPIRSTNQNFYNAIVFKYDKLAIEDKFIRGQIVYSAASASRFPNQGNKPLTVESNGLRDNADTDSIIRINSLRWLDRYKFAGELFKGIKTNIKAGLKIECGDIVILNSEGMKIVDISTGNREASQKVYEVINKSINLKTGEVSLDLLSTGFDLTGRYGGISPSTIIGVGSTTSEIVITPSYLNTTLKQERRKWENLVGENIELHNRDYSYSEETTLVQLSPTDDSVFIVDPPVSTPPASGYWIDIARYGTATDPEFRKKLKSIYTFIDYYAIVVSGTDNFTFDVSGQDSALFNVGLPVLIHNIDWSIQSVEANVVSVIGTTVTVDTDLGFTPASGQIVELIGFKDGGQTFRMI